MARTVGKLIEGTTPAEIAEMRFADIACGSGSFLLGIYDLLLNYHSRYYNDHPRKVRKGDYIEKDGVLHLSLRKKREILLNNIYGVDIDPQAVEVTQLSLYLKLLEEETIASARGYQLQMYAAILPSLNRNIICGNSLIEDDILERGLFERPEEKTLNPMNFEEAFPNVIKRGGFDAVVGNPPYVRIQTLPRNQVAYLTSHFEAATGNCDIYVSFTERGYSLLKRDGILGQILPNKFIKTDYGRGLRKIIADHKALAEIIDFGAEQVFDQATTYTCLLFLTKRPNKHFSFAEAKATRDALVAPTFTVRNTADLSAEAWAMSDNATAQLLAKLSAGTVRLLDLPAEMNRGSTGNDEVFVVSREADIEEDATRIPNFASDFGRYRFSPTGKWRVIFPYLKEDGGFRLYRESELKQHFPKTFAYLRGHRNILKQRKGAHAWYGFSAPRSLATHERARILIPLLANRGLCSLIPENMSGKLCPMAGGGFTLSLDSSCDLRPEYVLGLLNSRLFFWWLLQKSNVFRGGWITCTKQYFGELPIRKLDLAIALQKAQHDHLVDQVEQLIAVKGQLSASKSERDRNFYQRKEATLERRIDDLVYGLYGLTSTEITLTEKEQLRESRLEASPTDGDILSSK